MRVGRSGKRFDEQWREIPDDTPVEIPVKLRQPRSMQEMVAMYVANAMALERRMSGDEEDAEVAEDLEVDEDGDGEILTPYELHAMAADVEREHRRKEWLDKNVRPVYNKRTAKKGEPESGRNQADERVSGAGRVGEASDVAGAVAGDSQKAGESVKPVKPAGGAG